MSELDSNLIRENEVGLVVYIHGIRHALMIDQETATAQFNEWIRGEGELSGRPKGSESRVVIGRQTGPIAVVYWYTNEDLNPM